jgi:hypothetical protein
MRSGDPREISRPAGENAGLRDDAARWGASALCARYDFATGVIFTKRSITESGVIPNEAAFQAERGISREVPRLSWRSARDPPGCRGDPREISRPAGENAGLRDDAAEAEPAHFAQDYDVGTGAISRRVQSPNPPSSRTKPFFRRREGSRAKSPGCRGDPREIPPAVVAIRARSLGPLEETRAIEMTQLRREPAHFAHDTTSQRE